MVTENVEQLSLETTDSPIDIGAAEVDTSPPVSYTHLTLPTIHAV